MNRWVCELGGFEMLLHGVGGYPADSSRELLIDAMQRWYVQFGAQGHPPIRGDENLAHAVARWNEFARLGAIYWGSPRGWLVTRPQVWSDRLIDEAQRRDTITQAAGVHTKQAYRPVRRRRR